MFEGGIPNNNENNSKPSSGNAFLDEINESMQRMQQSTIYQRMQQNWRYQGSHNTGDPMLDMVGDLMSMLHGRKMIVQDPKKIKKQSSHHRVCYIY